MRSSTSLLAVERITELDLRIINQTVPDTGSTYLSLCFYSDHQRSRKYPNLIGCLRYVRINTRDEGWQAFSHLQSVSLDECPANWGCFDFRIHFRYCCCLFRFVFTNLQVSIRRQRLRNFLTNGFFNYSHRNHNHNKNTKHCPRTPRKITSYETTAREIFHPKNSHIETSRGLTAKSGAEN